MDETSSVMNQNNANILNCKLIQWVDSKKASLTLISLILKKNMKHLLLRVYMDYVLMLCLTLQ